MTADVRVGVRPPLATFERGASSLSAFLAAVHAAGLDHLCVGDHVSFRDGYGYDGLVQATALAPTAKEAEALAKAALLAGRVEGPSRLRHGGVLVLDDRSTSWAPPPAGQPLAA